MPFLGRKGSAAATEHALAERAKRLEILSPVISIRQVAYDHLASVYRGASALLTASGSEHGQELRWALACGVAVAAVQTGLAGSVLGGAGYLTPNGDARALGAACLTLLVQPEVATDLQQKGLLRAMAYHDEGVLRSWVAALQAAAQNREGEA